MPTKKIKDLDELPSCDCPEHNPPGHIVYSPGVYEHICPLCRDRVEFVIHKTMSTNSILPTLEIPTNSEDAKKLKTFGKKVAKVFTNIEMDSEGLQYHLTLRNKKEYLSFCGTETEYNKETEKLSTRLQHCLDDLETFVIDFLKK